MVINLYKKLKLTNYRRKCVAGVRNQHASFSNSPITHSHTLNESRCTHFQIPAQKDGQFFLLFHFKSKKDTSFLKIDANPQSRIWIKSRISLQKLKLEQKNSPWRKQVDRNAMPVVCWQRKGMDLWQLFQSHINLFHRLGVGWMEWGRSTFSSRFKFLFLFLGKRLNFFLLCWIRCRSCFCRIIMDFNIF